MALWVKLCHVHFLNLEVSQSGCFPPDGRWCQTVVSTPPHVQDQWQKLHSESLLLWIEASTETQCGNLRTTFYSHWPQDTRLGRIWTQAWSLLLCMRWNQDQYRPVQCRPEQTHNTEEELVKTHHIRFIRDGIFTVCPNWGAGHRWILS